MRVLPSNPNSLPYTFLSFLISFSYHFLPPNTLVQIQPNPSHSSTLHPAPLSMINSPFPAFPTLVIFLSSQHNQLEGSEESTTGVDIEFLRQIAGSHDNTGVAREASANFVRIQNSTRGLNERPNLLQTLALLLIRIFLQSWDRLHTHA